MEKHRWTRNIFESVDWIPLESYLSSVPLAKQTKILKLIHGWQFTSLRKAMMTSIDDQKIIKTSLCPLQCGENDHNHHYLRCTKQLDSWNMQKELLPLGRMLAKRNTHPDLAKMILLRSMRSFLTSEPPPSSGLPLTPSRNKSRRPSSYKRR